MTTTDRGTPHPVRGGSPDGGAPVPGDREGVTLFHPSPGNTVETNVSDLTTLAMESPEKLRLAFEAAPLAMVVTSAGGEVLDCNRAAAELAGYNREDLRNRSADDLYEKPQERSSFLSRLASKGTLDGEIMKFRTARGEAIPTRVHAEFFTLPNGTRVIFSTVEDLRPIAEARARLLESTGRFRLLFENAHDAIFFTNTDGLIIDANPAALRLFDGSAADMRRVNVRDIYVDLADRDVILQRLASGSEVTDATVMFRTLRGRTFLGEVNAKHYHDEAGRVAGVQGTVRDVTARVRAEQDLERSLSYLKALFDASPLAIIGTDLQWRCTIWNPAAERLYGWTTAEMIGRNVEVLVPPEEMERYRVDREQALRGAVKEERVVQRVRKDGTRFDASVSFAPIRSGGAAPTGLMAVADDVTERLRMEARLRQSEKLEAIGRLAGGVAHDFNNILTVIMAEASSILANAANGSEMASSAREIEAAAAKAAALTRQLLAFGRQQVLAPVRTDLNTIVSDTDRLLRRLIREDIEIVLDLHDGPCEVTADVTQLHQVLMNLCLNARDAMPAGGTLTIRTDCVKASKPVMTVDATLPPGEYVTLEIADTGVGMDPETTARIFEPFFTTKGQMGTGLGLATVLGIVKQSGGAITVQSARGTGTRFTVHFPMMSSGLAPRADLPR